LFFYPNASHPLVHFLTKKKQATSDSDENDESTYEVEEGEATEVEGEQGGERSPKDRSGKGKESESKDEEKGKQKECKVQLRQSSFAPDLVRQKKILFRVPHQKMF
jgi:hypothetical protein